MNSRTRFAVVASHPIQYYAPYYRALAKHSDLDVCTFFASRFGCEKKLDPDMGVEFAWKTDLLSGYRHVFLPGAERIERLSFRGVDNPDVGRALAEYRPDVVLLHGYTLMTMLRALVWCRRSRVPALMISDSSLHSGTGRAMRALKQALVPLIFRQFSGFLCIGDANERYVRAYGVPRDCIFRVPNVVDEGFWTYRERRQQERARLRAELGVGEDALLVLYVGKLIPRKRPGDLLAALARLRSMAGHDGPIRVLFAGDGAQREALERETAARELPARFLGFVNIDSLPAYFCAADVLAHPAEIETFGVITIEAAIIGLPLLLSDRVGAIGPRSIARPGENALVYPCGDVAALATALRRLAGESGTRASMAAASLRISQELDARMAVRGTLAAVEHCLRRAGEYQRSGRRAPA
jgi:glycosyltransferase involved in cell wall biosynthesis